ncbi:MAG: hypothetical protein ACREKS_11155 [Candidatus Rokuibacteriota bacterium]
MAIAEHEGIPREHPTLPIRERLWRSSALLVAVAGATWGQGMLEHRDHPVDGLILLALAAALFVVAARGQSPRDTLLAPQSRLPSADGGPLIPSGRARALLLVSTVGFAAVAFLEFAENRVSVSPLTAMLLSLACFMVASVDRPRRSARGDAQLPPHAHRRVPWAASASRSSGSWRSPSSSCSSGWPRCRAK